MRTGGKKSRETDVHIIEHEKHLKESRKTLVQFCEHKPIEESGD